MKQAVVLQREEIEEMTESPASMMPEKLLHDPDDQQIQDFIAYLMTTARVPLPTAIEGSE